MSFRQQTAAFFDELAKIQDSRMESRDEEVDRATMRPFSSMLTQDEEPYEYYRPVTQYQPEDAEIILGRRIA